MRPILCLITDRARFGSDWAIRIPAQAAAAARAGVQLIQVREPDLDGGALLQLVRGCLEAVTGTGARVLVNDRVDVALAAGAHGVHLRARSMPASRVRGLAPRPFLVGQSVHHVEEAVSAASAGDLDYLVFGTVFETASKPGREAAGLTALAETARRVPIPVLAVGGMTVPRLAEVRAAGAAGAAAISLFASIDSAGSVNMGR